MISQGLHQFGLPLIEDRLPYDLEVHEQFTRNVCYKGAPVQSCVICGRYSILNLFIKINKKSNISLVLEDLFYIDHINLRHIYKDLQGFSWFYTFSTFVG